MCFPDDGPCIDDGCGDDILGFIDGSVTNIDSGGDGCCSDNDFDCSNNVNDDDDFNCNDDFNYDADFNCNADFNYHDDCGVDYDVNCGDNYDSQSNNVRSN